MSMLLRKVRFRLALWIWAVLVPLIAWRRRDIGALLQLTEVGQGAPFSGLEPAYIVRSVKRATRRPVLMKTRPCLREGLLATRFLRLAGFRPSLHFAVDKKTIASDILAAHCWVVLEDRAILNPPTASMVQVLTYADGRLARALPIGDAPLRPA